MKTGAKILIGVGILSVITVAVILISRKSRKQKQAELDSQKQAESDAQKQQYNPSTFGYNPSMVSDNSVTKPDTKPQSNAGTSVGNLFGNVNTGINNVSSQAGSLASNITPTPMKFGDKVAIKTNEEYIYSKPVGSSSNRLGKIKSDTTGNYVGKSTGGFTEILVKKYISSWGFPHYSDSVAGDRVFIPTERIKKV